MYCLKTILVVAGIALTAPWALGADEYEQPPIRYSASQPQNKVTALQNDLLSKKVTLKHDDRFGYLTDLLGRLNVPVESQLLVFSKTSRQRDRITPRTPRAIYFNEDTYVGYCHEGEILEVSTTDANLGTVFYTLGQQDKPPSLVRQTESCLQCHSGTASDSIPGHLVRSVFVDRSGFPLLNLGNYRVDTTTPFENRWGGWYVTGTHGQQQHLGNQTLPDRDATRPTENRAGQNVTSLRGRFESNNYPTPHSDIVALMVFEHQTHVHNLLVQANFSARRALHYEAELNRALGDPPGQRLESTTRRIESAADKLLEGMLFVDEALLKESIAGTSGYQDKFAEGARRDRSGRSLRDFDLTRRLFKYPCSYLIYSSAFDDLPSVMKACVVKKLLTILSGNGGDTYTHLTETDRQALSEILRDTKPELFAGVKP